MVEEPEDFVVEVNGSAADFNFIHKVILFHGNSLDCQSQFPHCFFVVCILRILEDLFSLCFVECQFDELANRLSSFKVVEQLKDFCILLVYFLV